MLHLIQCNFVIGLKLSRYRWLSMAKNERLLPLNLATPKTHNPHNDCASSKSSGSLWCCPPTACSAKAIQLTMHSSLDYFKLLSINSFHSQEPPRSSHLSILLYPPPYHGHLLHLVAPMNVLYLSQPRTPALSCHSNKCLQIALTSRPVSFLSRPSSDRELTHSAITFDQLGSLV